MLYLFDDIIKTKYKTHVHTNTRPCIKGKKNYTISCYDKMFRLFPHYFHGINIGYITDLFKTPSQVKLLIYTNELEITNIKKDSIVGMIIYYKYRFKHYVLAIGTHSIYRNMGYGILMLDEFVEYVQKHNCTSVQKCSPNIKIFIDSLSTTIGFYKSYGFVETNINSCKELFKFENSTHLNTTSGLMVYHVFN